MSEAAKNHFKAWELALLCTLCLMLSLTVWAQGRMERITGSLIRLHVLAVDDSEQEQALKLRVRDAVLSFLGPQLEEASDRDEAGAILEASLPSLERAAAAAAEGRPVSVTLTRESYPTRRYGPFALPAGRYDSLRVRERGTTGGASCSRLSVWSSRAWKRWRRPSARRPFRS